jgi:hypothetical protein
LRLRRIYLRVKRDPQRFAYTDLATRVMNDEETITLELFGSDAAQAYASEQRRLKDMRNARSGAVPIRPLASHVEHHLSFGAAVAALRASADGGVSVAVLIRPQSAGRVRHAYCDVAMWSIRDPLDHRGGPPCWR